MKKIIFTFIYFAAILFVIFTFFSHEEETQTEPVAIPTELAAPQTAVLAEQSYEIPSSSNNDGLLIEHTGYTLSYNIQTNCPNWVAWELTAEEVQTQETKRVNNFRGDELVPARNRVETSDYKNTGYDRGHMCPAADMKWSIDAMSECFYMSNICPQVPALNQKWWEHLEAACRRWAKHEGRVYICCGPLYDSDTEKVPTTIGNKVKIQVPDAFFKVVLSLAPGKEKAIGFIYHNIADRQSMEDVAVSVDKIEEITGIDFFYLLDDELESNLESNYDLKVWN